MKTRENKTKSTCIVPPHLFIKAPKPPVVFTKEHTKKGKSTTNKINKAPNIIIDTSYEGIPGIMKDFPIKVA